LGWLPELVLIFAVVESRITLFFVEERLCTQ